MSRQTRRTFLKRAAATAGVATAFTVAGTKASGRVLGANDTVRVAVAGINGRGREHFDAFARMDKVQVTHLVDPDSRLFESRAAAVKKLGGNTPKCVQDIRKALEDPELDAVSIATCDHWHAPITVWACQAGKDVYVEKPCSCTIFEGQQSIAAARKYKRVVQHGTQQRSMEKRAGDIAALRSGKYGRLLVAKGNCFKPRWSIGFKPTEQPPETLDFNLWLGPRPKQPFNRNLVHYNWHWFWDFGNGDMGNMGAHELDVARWGTGRTLPKRVFSAGCRYTNEKGFRDQAETPDMLLSVFDYGDVQIVFETRGLTGKHDDWPRDVGNEFYTTEGVLRTHYGTFSSDRTATFTPKAGGKTYDVEIEPIEVIPGGPFGSFIEAMRQRRTTDCNAEIQEAHYSMALLHLGNISYRLGKDTPFSRTPPQLEGNEIATEGWERIKGNLQGALHMDLAKYSYTLGEPLEFDAETEQFIGNSRANAMLTREYRAPFIIPKEV